MLRRISWIVFSGLLLTLVARTLDAPVRPPNGALLQGPPVRAGTDSEQTLFAPAEREGFSFVLFGDRTGGNPSGLALLEEGVRMANRLDPDFSMTVGDMVQGYNTGAEWMPQMREYKGIMDRLEAPWYPVAGNHDVYGDNGRAGGNVELYKEHFGPLYYSFDYRWAHFVVLYSDESLSFRDPAVNQNLSQEQLDWLRDDLRRTKAEQVFVLLHHPRWTRNYEGSNWPEVHELLKRDGRVRAVFGGHQHRWRDDGVTDGIHYYVLSVTGANSGSFEESSDMHQIAHVRVRRDDFSMSVVPVGSLYGGDLVLGSEVDDMIGLTDGAWCSTEGGAMVAREGRRESAFTVRVENPTARRTSFRLDLPLGGAWNLRTDRAEVALEPGASHHFRVAVTAPPFSGHLAAIDFEVSLLYELQSGIVQPIRLAKPVPLGLDAASGVVAADARSNKVLVLDGSSCVRVPMDWRWEALTLECWVRGAKQDDWRGLVSKTQSSGFSLNWGGRNPDGNLRLRGRSGYVTVEADEAPDEDSWKHLAFSWDGEIARMFVDGKLQGEKEARGKLHGNGLPLFVGADTNGRGNPEHRFRGRIDEVRVSRVARYTRPFRPERRHEPDGDTVLLLHFDNELGGVFPDASDELNHGWAVGKPRLESERL